SALGSAALAAPGTGHPGCHPAGWLRQEAHHVVRARAFASVGPAQRRAAQRAALPRAASLGIAAVHECAGPGTSSEDDLLGLLTLAGDQAPEVYGYWGAPMSARKTKELEAACAAGDICADGALVARTAHLREPYRDAPAAPSAD